MADEPAYYVIIVSQRGYLPEADPYVVADERPPTLVLETIKDEIEHAMPEPQFESEDSTNFDAGTDAWDKLYAEVAADLERAADFDTSVGSGFGYTMPDGYVIEAMRHTPEQLIELGYTPGEDFELPASASD